MTDRDIDYHSVRYTEDQFYPYFSNGKMSVSEMYVALANGFLDPTSLAPITIFEYKDHLYCINTRRLTIAKELQRMEKFDVLKRFPIQYATKYDKQFEDQYFDLVNKRLPAMEKKALDGPAVKLYHKSDYMCCYNLESGKFRDDLDEHIACDHLKMDVLDFKNMNVSECSRCNRTCRITIIKPSSIGRYRFIQICACQTSRPMVLYTTEKPWTEVTLQEICNVFLSLRTENTEQESLTFVKSVSAPIPLTKRSSQSTVLSHQQKPLVESSLYKKRFTKEERSNGFVKWFCLFLLRCYFIIILFGLIIIFVPKNDHKLN